MPKVQIGSIRLPNELVTMTYLDAFNVVEEANVETFAIEKLKKAGYFITQRNCLRP